MKYVIYILDTETTGLDYNKNDVIELSLYRLSDDIQKTWCIKPINMENIDLGSLKINGHILEDLRHLTKIGIEKYLDPNKIIIEIENWIAEDGVPLENRVLVGHNVSFDKEFINQLWTKCNSKDTFPFGRRSLDTMSIEFMMDMCKEKMAEGYSLSNLTKKYGIKNEKKHSAESDTKATKEVFIKQIEFFKSKLKD